ncbi:Phosphoenolpyruvate carboxykinase (ATP) [Nitrospina gracilis 3/211]|uniref:Phosphoenolpyruvate carboxykinase (ATP) n=1 Tax=Nitrospina gracilis (strain 3/211) TaxID=1266370 RepID=M1YUR8_NITG3|nr:MULTISPECIES: phosphoenolpyruvate carboxykinase (ATP) [Nitrospina]MCF8722561.1 phosphoenolpyruvate carboxykinase (ATP) [Nitrospina sp. Nb-3]CCQ89241.1 Phosphoenolpyruvate carboxykinase (ATP) [Nitrospina gracilis 3/211]
MAQKILKHKVGLEHHGIRNVKQSFWNLSTPELYEHIIRNQEGHLSHLGPVVVTTGEHTGRSPNDRFIVQEPSSQENVWWGKVNEPFAMDKFDSLYERVLAYLQGKNVYVQDCMAGSDPKYQLHIRVITEYAWQSLFARNMFIQIKDRLKLENHSPAFTIIGVPNFKAVPKIDGTNSETFIIIDFSKQLILIGGTHYAGEIKKSIFSVLNYLLPHRHKVLSMHCSANMGEDNDTAIFFGLSGTGKTTLSTDPHRKLIGDDEHGWSQEGVFNFEGGCYAKAIRLNPKAEPDIHECTRRFGTILENVVMDPTTRRLDLDDASLTENTRAAYPLTHIAHTVEDRRGGHPKNVIMLTCDAYGIMPPVAKLTPEQAMYHFISGYTAKVAGTERGMSREPTAVFSTCFGAPFMVLHPSVYANLLGQRIADHHVHCWLVNTGWTGGPYGVGERMSIAHTRAMINAILDGKLSSVETRPDPIFGIHVPTSCPDVPAEVLNPRNTWKNPKAYDEKARELAAQFVENFKEYESAVSREILEGGPRLPNGKKASIKKIK